MPKKRPTRDPRLTYMTPEHLQRLRDRMQMSRKQARDNLAEVVYLLQRLMRCDNDDERITLWSEFYQLTHDPYDHNCECVLLWSRVANGAPRRCTPKHDQDEAPV